MSPVRFALIAVTALVLSGGAIAVADRDDRREQRKAERGHARLVDAEGKRVGKVVFRSRGDRTLVAVRARRLPAGFHGFHIHAAGDCSAPDFTSAMGHLKSGDQTHGDHVGDMPVLLVNENGRARAAFLTDRFAIGDLRDEDGSAVIVHEKPDNYANIPDRYDPDPDEATLSTGDAGSRLACGEVR